MISFQDHEAYKAIGQFIGKILPDVDVVVGQENRVPVPKENFCIINFAGRKYHSMNRHAYTDEDGNKEQAISRSTELIVSVDFYGTSSGENAHQFCTAFNDEYAYSSMPADIKPLKSTDPVQIAFHTPENQYEERWRLECSLQLGQVVSVNQEFFDEQGDIDVINVPETYPYTGSSDSASDDGANGSFDTPGDSTVVVVP